MAKLYGFGKEEHLYLKKEIEGLFSSDTKMLAYPYRAIYSIIREGASAPPVKVLISVPKRKLKHAVDRNKVKRLVRESYRLNKRELTEVALQNNTTIHLGIIFIGEDVPSFHKTEKCIKQILSRIVSEIDTK